MFGAAQLARCVSRKDSMALLVIVLVAFSWLAGAADSAIAAEYVGSALCTRCHEAQASAWRGSHHDLAMLEASEKTVLGDFNDAEISAHDVTSRFFRAHGGFYVRTDGPDGKLHDYPIRYTFGWYPLQQYLIEFPRGRLQSLGLAWDSRSKEDRGQRWFHLYPDETMDHRHPLHWTGRDQTWNYQCAECHSTNLKKNYDVQADSYRTTFSEVNVACEACHGPGSGHIEWAAAAEQGPARREDADKGLVVDLADRDGGPWNSDAEGGKPRRTEPREDHTQVELCARCHSRRGQIRAAYEHGKRLGNTHRLALLDDHLYFPDGQIKDEVYVYGSFIQSRMYRAGVTCSDCHDPHSLQLRVEGNAVCGGCHQPARYDAKGHHHHEPDSAGAACIACHMPQRVYMVNDERADHSLRVPRPDLSPKLGTPNACNGCHDDKPPEWAADAVAAWHPDSAYRGPHFGETLHAAATGAPDAGDRLLGLAVDRSAPGIARASAVDRLRSHAEPRHLFTIQRLLADDDPLVRAASVRFFEIADAPTRVDKVWPLLEDPDRVVRLEAARVLAPLLRQPLPDPYRRQLKRAMEEYTQAQRANADRPESHLNLGLIAFATGDASQAEQAYGTALQLDPAFAPGYVNLADLYRQQGRDAEGERVLRSGIEAVPDNADLQHALGLSLVRQKRLDESLPYLGRAAALGEERPRYAYVYALALQGAGDVPKALDVLSEADKRHPGHREILVTLVTTYRDQGDLEQARRYADELVERYPQDAQARVLALELDQKQGHPNGESEK